MRLDLVVDKKKEKRHKVKRSNVPRGNETGLRVVVKE